MVFSPWETVQDSYSPRGEKLSGEPCDCSSYGRDGCQATVQGKETRIDPAISLKEETEFRVREAQAAGTRGAGCWGRGCTDSSAAWCAEGPLSLQPRTGLYVRERNCARRLEQESLERSRENNPRAHTGIGILCVPTSMWKDLLIHRILGRMLRRASPFITGLNQP